MRQARKEELLRRFPAVPESIMEKMKGRLADNFAVFLTNGNELFVRCYHRYSDGKLIERQRYVFAKDGSVRWGKDDGAPWTIRKEFREPVFCQSCYGYNFNNTYKWLNMEAIGQSCMKYCCHDLYKGNLLIEYLHLYCRHPNVEYLMKAGYGDLIGEYYTGYWGGIQHIAANRHINWKSNNLLKMLGLSRTEFKLLEGHEEYYEAYVEWREVFPKIKPSGLLTIAEQFRHEQGSMQNFCADTGLKPDHIARYLKAHKIPNWEYSDYLSQCRKLHYDLHDTAISMPRRFKDMHTRLSEIVEYNATRKMQQALSERIESRKSLEFTTGMLFIRQPTDVMVIISEGKELHHCVGGYAERHANGKLHIMFIRRADKPDVPFYTVEVDLFGEIVQVRGLRNCKTTPEVDAFIEAYKEHLAAVFGKEKRRKTA